MSIDVRLKPKQLELDLGDRNITPEVLQAAAALSSAISLKRIADVLERLLYIQENK